MIDNLKQALLENHISKKSLLILLLLLVGLLAGVFLVQRENIFKSKAYDPDYSLIEISKVENGQKTPIYCENGNSCNTDSLDINIRIPSLDALSH